MQENVNKTNDKKFFIPALVLCIIGAILLVFACLFARSASQIMKKGAAGIIGGIIMLPLFVIFDFGSMALSLSATVLSAVGVAKSDNKKKQIVMLIINALILIGCIVAALLTLVAKI